MHDRNGRPPIPTVRGGVPIIGRAVYMGCSQGHVERAEAPFAVQIPEGPKLEICRACWLGFMRFFSARQLTDAEIEGLRTSGHLDEIEAGRS